MEGELHRLVHWQALPGFIEHHFLLSIEFGLTALFMPSTTIACAFKK